MISAHDGQALVRLARDSIESYFSGEEPDTSQVKHLDAKNGVFVTIHKDKELRGCIGFPISEQKLYEGTIAAARAAAFQDPRFPPLERDELSKVRIEVSVLTEPARIEAKTPEERISSVSVGEDGLVIQSGYRSGLLLPQVPVEQGWDAETYLCNLCIKAGLATDSWREEDADIYKFQAQIFSEDDSAHQSDRS